MTSSVLISEFEKQSSSDAKCSEQPTLHELLRTAFTPQAAIISASLEKMQPKDAVHFNPLKVKSLLLKQKKSVSGLNE